MINLKQLPDSSAGLEGATTGGNGEFIPVTIPYVAGTVATGSAFVASRPYVVQAIIGRTIVAGTGGACTLSIYSVPSGTATASGTLLHTGSFNLVGTINTNQTLTMTAAAQLLPAGSSIGYVITGTATSAVGTVTILLNPA